MKKAVFSCRKKKKVVGILSAATVKYKNIEES